MGSTSRKPTPKIGVGLEVLSSHHHHNSTLNSKARLIDRCIYPTAACSYKKSEHPIETGSGLTQLGKDKMLL